MNSPVTHAECIKHREQLKTEFQQCIKEDRIDFKEAVDKVESWAGKFADTVDARFIKIEGKIDYMVFGVLFLALEGIVALVIYIFNQLGGKL